MDRLYRKAPHSCDFCRNVLVDNLEMCQGRPRIGLREATYNHRTTYNYEQVVEKAEGETGCLLFKKFLLSAVHFNLPADATAALSITLRYWDDGNSRYHGDLCEFDWSWKWYGSTSGRPMSPVAIQGR